MGRLYDAFVEVGPRFTGFGDIKKQGDAAGKEYGKALAEAAAKAAQANVRKLGEALAKARSGEADAAGKVRIAGQRLPAERGGAGDQQQQQQDDPEFHVSDAFISVFLPPLAPRCVPHCRRAMRASRAGCAIP